MATRAEVITARELHLNGCTRRVGPRGGKEEIVRRAFPLSSVKLELHGDGYSVKCKLGRSKQTIEVTPANAAEFHTILECPLTKTDGPVDNGIAGAVV